MAAAFFARRFDPVDGFLPLRLTPAVAFFEP
jgi:hypothetical protein